MTILFLDQFGDLGGAQLCLLDLLPGVKDRGWQPIVAAPAGKLLERAAVCGAAVEELRLPELRSASKPVADWLVFAKRLRGMAADVRRLIDVHRPDMVYVNGPRLLPAVALVNPRARCVFHSHHRIEQAVARKIARFAVGRLDAQIIACCRYVANQWTDSRVKVIYNGVAPIGFRADAPPGPVRIGVIGRISPEKGQAVFLSTAQILSERHPDWQFDIIGGPAFGDAAADDYSKQIRSRPGPNVRFLGWLDDPSSALSRLSVLAIPSISSEATTRVIPEAWAAGVPVVASNVGGIAEIVEHARTGFLVPPGDAQALAEACEAVAALAPQDRTTMVLAGREQYERQFTRERYAREICELLAGIGAR